MLETSILEILRMFPRGSTNGQLLLRLGVGGHRYDPSALLAALTRLAERGDIERRGDRWLPVFPTSVASARRGEPARGASGDHDILYAMPGLLGTPGPAVAFDADDRSIMTASWSQVMSYYASTQRQDPRGSVERFPDQHGGGWQLIDLRGRWWTGDRIIFAAQHIPGKFRQALATSGHRGSAAIGWPMTVLNQSPGTTCLPGLLLPVSWNLEDMSLTVTVDPVVPVINPAWLRLMRRRLAMSEDKLVDAILGTEDGLSLEAISPRLAHALAAMGGAVLRPADIAREMSLSGEGLRNAAALILPDEAAFTRRVAEDLQKIALWDQRTRGGTALGAVIEKPSDPGGPVVPIAPPLPLSDLQAQAAQAAMAGPVTAIQGPPGTGKSQTIVTLIATAIAAGLSVLFVARNHRALDEVERRVADLLPDIPIFVRGRDADGERDNSFLDGMRDIIAGPIQDSRDAANAKLRQEELLRQMAALAEVRRVHEARSKLHIELSDLAERAQVLGAVATERGSRGWQNWLAWITRLLRREPEASSLPDDLPLPRIEARMAQQKKLLARMPDVTFC
jgi:hypothetical protein